MQCPLDSWTDESIVAKGNNPFASSSREKRQTSWAKSVDVLTETTWLSDP